MTRNSQMSVSVQIDTECARCAPALNWRVATILRCDDSPRASVPPVPRTWGPGRFRASTSVVANLFRAPSIPFRSLNCPHFLIHSYLQFPGFGSHPCLRPSRSSPPAAAASPPKLSRFDRMPQKTLPACVALGSFLPQYSQRRNTHACDAPTSPRSPKTRPSTPAQPDHHDPNVFSTT